MQNLAESDAAALAGMFALAERCFCERDFATWAALYAEDGCLQPPNAPTIVGREAIEAFLAALPFEEMAWSDVQVQGDGNMAYGTSSYRLKLTEEAGGAEDRGKQLVVFRRASADSAWQVVVVSFNSDLPPADSQ